MHYLLKTITAGILVLQATSAGATSPRPFGISFPGEGRRGCAPNDGGAFVLTFTGSNDALLIIRINVSADRAVGQFALGNPDSYGGMSVAICPAGFNPEVPCSAAQRAVVSVLSVRRRGIHGLWNIRFPSGERLRGRFRALLDPSPQPRCGE